MERKPSEVSCLRYIYIVEVDNRGKKSKYFGHKNILYTGQTNDLARRVHQHMSGVGSKFMKGKFPNAQKKLVFVDYLFGTEPEAMKEEERIKRMSRERKEKLIASDRNQLVSYRPFRAIILWSYYNEDSQTVIKL